MLSRIVSIIGPPTDGRQVSPICERYRSANYVGTVLIHFLKKNIEPTNRRLNVGMVHGEMRPALIARVQSPAPELIEHIRPVLASHLVPHGLDRLAWRRDTGQSAGCECIPVGQGKEDFGHLTDILRFTFSEGDGA